MTTPMHRMTTTAAPTLHRMCGLYKAEALAPDFKRAGTPLREVARMLEEATGTAARTSAAGIERVRLTLLERGAK